MNDLERLDEALESTHPAVNVPLDSEQYQRRLLIFDAARAYRNLVVSGAEPDYEAAARAEYDPGDDGWWEKLSDRGRAIRVDAIRPVVDAALGGRLLVDPPEEEER